MTPPIKFTNQKIGQIGNIPIHIPITTIGEGKPHLAIVCGIHGDEIACLIISRYFVQRLQEETLRGTVSIITAANPFAQAIRTRVLPSDYLDMNRVGQGDQSGVLTERLANFLYEYLIKCNFVIDLHEFEMSTPTMAIYIPSQSKETNESILGGISAFNPAIIWSLKVTTKVESKYSSSLLSELVKEVPGFGIETSHSSELSSSTILQNVESLIEVTKFIGIIKGHYRTSAPPAFIRTPIYSDQAGIWIPKTELLKEINQEDVIGEITLHNLVEHTLVKSPKKGTLIQLARPNLVDTGTSLFSIGEKDSSLIKEFEKLEKT